MKRALCIILALVLVLALAPAAFAEWDLSGLSFDELVALKDQINLALWNSADWQEVTVPQGVWQVGADIPAGKWTVKPEPEGQTYIKVSDKLEEGGADIRPTITGKLLRAEDWYKFDPATDVPSMDVELKDGMYVSFEYGPAVFTPYAGKPSLGFK